MTIDPQWDAECHIFQIYGDLRLWKRIGAINNEDKLHWHVLNALKENKNLLALTHKDFISGWKRFQEVKFKKPEMKFALVFAINAMKQRLQREENKKEADRKKAIASDEAQLDPHFKEMAMKIAEDKQSDEQKMHLWWNTSQKKVVYWRRLVEKHPDIPATNTIVRAWAWEEKKKENSDG